MIVENKLSELLPEICTDSSVEFKTECMLVLLSFKRQIHEKYPYINPECNLRELIHAIKFRQRCENEVRDTNGISIFVYEYLLIAYLISVNETLYEKYDGDIPEGVILRNLLCDGFRHTTI